MIYTIKKSIVNVAHPTGHIDQLAVGASGDAVVVGVVMKLGGVAHRVDDRGAGAPQPVVTIVAVERHTLPADVFEPLARSLASRRQRASCRQLVGF